MELKSRLWAAWQIVTGQARELEIEAQGEDNPYAEVPEAGGMLYESLDASIHALWPLIAASGYGGLMGYRGVVYGVLTSITLNEDARDQEAVAWAVAQIVNEYVEPDQAAMDMPGISLTEGGEERIDAELIAFLGASIEGAFEDAVAVFRNMRQTHASRVLDRRADVDDMEEAEKRVVVEFLGSCLASTATQYVLDTVGDDEDDDDQ